MTSGDVSANDKPAVARADQTPDYPGYHPSRTEPLAVRASPALSADSALVDASRSDRRAARGRDMGPGVARLRAGLSMRLTTASGPTRPPYAETIEIGRAMALRDVTETDIILLLRAARRELRDGIFVYQIRLDTERNWRRRKNQKPVGYRYVRQLYVGYQPEYFELTTSERSETVIHMGSLKTISADPAVIKKCPEFVHYDPSLKTRGGDDEPAVLRASVSPLINPKACLLLQTCDLQRVCLLFRSERERRLTQFHIAVEQKAIKRRYAAIENSISELCANSHLAVTLAHSGVDH